MSNPQKTPNKITKEMLLNRMINRIRQSLELPEILSATVAEMRAFLQTDRVKIYRFQEDGTGQVIAESIYKNRLPPLKSLHFPAGDIPPHAREMFVKASQRTIVNVATQQMILNRSDCPDTTGDLTVEDIQTQPISQILQRPVDPCHIEYLSAMGVQSSLVVPILHQNELWGLLISHHAEPKAFSEVQLQIVQQVADQVSLAITQSTLLSQARARARREGLINQVSTLLHSPLNVQQILQQVLEMLVKALDGSGGRLYCTIPDHPTAHELYTWGTQPYWNSTGKLALVEDYPFWQQLMQESGSLLNQEELSQTWARTRLESETEISNALTSVCLNLRVVSDLYQDPQLVAIKDAFHSTAIRSLIVLPLQYAQHCLGCLTVFRDEIETDIVWAGRFDPDRRQNRVRESFEAWRELKQGQARRWTSTDIEVVQSLGTHLSMAVMQSQLYQWEREHRLLVEMRNQELSDARTTAEEASRFKSHFLSSTSHELRTPLASTLNYLRLLKEGFYDDEEEFNEYVEAAYQSAENLTAIINDVLDLAKIEAGRMQVNWEWVDLPSLLQQQRNLFRLESRNKGVNFVIDCCEVEQVWADEMKLRQVLTNLISNAFKFTDHGEVRVCVRPQPQNRVKISVVDTGIGIEMNQAQSLFEPFIQADGSIRRRYGGTGLGLTICRQLVELMGGEIEIESEGLGQGTTVTFTLFLRQN